jgi:methionine-gamma-lyase
MYCACLAGRTNLLRVDMLSSQRTRAVHAGRDDLVDLGVHAAPIDLSTTYPARDVAAEARRLDAFANGATLTSLDGSSIYARVTNPTVERFERAIAELEGFDDAVAFASGMAAVSACLLAMAETGLRHVVAVRPLYGTTDHLLGSGLLGTEVTWTRPEGVGAALRADTGLVFVETPANPTLAEIDLAAVAAACASRAGMPVPLLVDNTFATPVLQHPGKHGAGLVLHSATKFIGGHGDVMGGIVACDATWGASLRQIRFVTGGVLHPLAAYLLLRGLPTLPLRMAAASASAALIAERLREHVGVRRVHYPGLDANRPRGQMESGGALVAFETVGDPCTVIGAVRLVTPAVSLGSVDTLIEHPASISHHIVDATARAEGAVSDRLLRLSVGLEDAEDLWRDLDQALRIAAAGRSGADTCRHHTSREPKVPAAGVDV